jgi:flagellar hook-length control protein FliK
MGGANNVVGIMAAYLNQGTAVANVSNVQTKNDTSKTAGTSFDSILNKVTDNMIQSKTTDTAKDVSRQAANVKSDSTAAGKSVEKAATGAGEKAQAAEDISRDVQATAADQTVVQTEETGTVSAELEEAINEAGEELISQIAETFELTEDEVVNAMQVLGLMAADLLNPTNLTQLITELSGQGERIELITDSDIYTSLQDLMEGAESMKMGLMNEFDLSEEEVQTALDDLGRDFGKNLEEAAKLVEPEIAAEKEPGIMTEGPKEPQVKAPVSEAFTDRAPEEEKSVEITVSSSKEGETKGNLQQGAESSNLFNQVMNNIADAAEAADTAQVSYTDRTQMEDIIRQITDKITISAKAEETSMELSLHPASLGNVNILLTSGKDGIVAKFTAQNEIVKEAVESQMLQLQQKFDEQGIKITSIEVTIASHGFEQNLDQQERNDQSPSDEKKTRGLRRINLTELKDEDAEPENEAERIAVQMMEANGNSVDYSA